MLTGQGWVAVVGEECRFGEQKLLEKKTGAGGDAFEATPSTDPDVLQVTVGV